METITAEVTDNVGIITLNRPKRLNAINLQMVSELKSVLDGWKEQSLRAVVLTGAGKAFAAGADISQMMNFSSTEAATFAAQGQAVFRLLEHFPAPTIAAVNGFALGGGCELAMCCDIILASDRAVFGQPEVKLGVIPGFGGTQRLLRRVGRQAALELMMTGRNVKSEEAVRLGIALRIAEQEVLPEALALAQKISRNGPVAVRLVKELIDKTDRIDMDAGLAMEAEAFGQCFDTDDQTEGMTAFAEKRTATFTGT